MSEVDPPGAGEAVPDAAVVPGVSPGLHVAGYLLEEQVGRGGMAVVYRAHDERLDRRVALKLLAPGLAADASFRNRFIRESRAAAAVDHPNIIPVFDAGEAGGELFIAMRYVQGGDVRSLLAGGEPLPPPQAWSIISQVASALDAAHAHGLIHRDVKPANMLLDPAGASTGPVSAETGASDSRHVYLSDFGISKQTLASNLTATGQFVGTLDYIAPEQIEGKTPDGRADQYSLACAAFEMLTGSPPFRKEEALAVIGAHLSEPPPPATGRRPGLPVAVDQVLARAMAKPREARYASCAEFAAELGRALTLLPPPQPTTPRPWALTEIADNHPAAVAPTGPGATPAPLAGQWAPDGQQGGYLPPGWYPGFTPTGPGWPTAPSARPPRGRLLLVITAVLAVAVVGVAAVVVIKLRHPAPGTGTGISSSVRTATTEGPSQSQTASSAAATQAAQVNTIVINSIASRGLLTSAESQILNNCSTLSPGELATYVSDIQTSADQRQAEYTAAQGLDTSALPNGADLKSALVSFLSLGYSW